MCLKNIIQLWLSPIDGRFERVTEEEIKISENLPPNKKRQFLYTRGFMRDILSKYLDIPPLDLPLEAYPGKPLKIRGNLGNISLSHCSDAFLLGWSDINLGVDIERKDRKFDARAIIKKFYLN